MLAGIASLMNLLTSVFKIGLLPTVALCLQWYDGLVGTFLNPLKDIIEFVAHQLRWPISLQPHWKHIFILFNLYIVRSVQNSYRQHRPTGFFRALLGLTIGILVGVASGALELQRDNAAHNFIVALVPVLGLFAYGSIFGVWQATVRYSVERSRRPQITSRYQALYGHVAAATRRTAVGTVIILAAIFLPFPKFVTSVGLAIVLILVILHAFYNLWDAFDQVKREPHHGGYLNTPSAKIGVDILRYFFYCAILIASNAFSVP